MGLGLYSHFRVQPNYSVEVVLHCRWGCDKNSNGVALYRVTQNKVHHLQVILYFIFEVNRTQVSYVIQCIILNEVQFNEVQL